MFENKNKKSPLGSTGSVSKGDDGMLSKESFINARMRVTYINPSELKINPLNSEYFAPLPPNEYKLLKDDIKERGIQDPLQVKQDNMLLTGENRLRIALELELNKVPIVYKDVMNDKEELDFLLHDNILRRHLTVREKEAIIKKRYGNQIFDYQRGGDRHSEEAKNTTNIPFAQQVADETGIPKGTVDRLLSKIRKEAKGEELKKDISLFNRLEKQLNSMKKNMNKSELDTDEKTKVLAILKELTTMVKKM